jgi:hypothetical protein
MMMRKLTKKNVMEHYYDDDELRDSLRMSVKGTLKWLEEANRFFSKATPKKIKKLQEKLIKEGW